MDQRIRRLISMSAVALICLLLVTARVPAQQRDPLQAAWRAMRAGTVNRLHLTGFGATYGVDRVRVPLPAYAADIDLARDVASTPQGFLKAARANDATTRLVPLGTEVAFTAGGRSYIGFINDDNEVDRVHSWVDDTVLGHVMVETLFRDYETGARGVPFPRHITRSHGNRPALDLWLSAIDVE
jgi:hypothetical protein